MTMPESSRLQFVRDLPICRILNGMWQVSGAHGPIDPRTAIPSMFDYLDAGLTTWDLADHYGPAEDFIGEFRRQLASARGQEALSSIQAFTKWVPRPGPMTRRIVENNIDISCGEWGGEAGPVAVPLVGLPGRPLPGSTDPTGPTARRGQDSPGGPDQLRHPAPAGHRPARYSGGVEPGAVFPHRPPPRSADVRLLPGASGLAAGLRRPLRRPDLGEVLGPAGAGGRAC